MAAVDGLPAYPILSAAARGAFRLPRSSQSANIRLIMHIITMRRLRKFWEDHASAKKPLQAWYAHVKQAQWQNLAEVKQDFPTVDQVRRLTIFNIGGNNYRLIVRIEYVQQKVYIRSIMNHAEYDKGKWKDDPWYS